MLDLFSIFSSNSPPILRQSSPNRETCRRLISLSCSEPIFPLPTGTMGDSQLFLDTFSITSLNAEKYDRVSRVFGHTENGDTELHLDINSELYPIAQGERIQLMLASTLNLDGTRDDGKGWRDVGRGEQSLADTWDYVCHGKIYRFQEGDEENM